MSALRVGAGRGGRVTAGAVVVLAVVGALVPLLHLLAVSLMSRSELVAGLLVSPDPRWGNWAEALAAGTPRAVANSVVAAVVGALLTLAVALPGAWAVVRFRAGGRALSATLLGPWLLPPVVAVVPLLLLLRTLGLTNTLLGLTLVHAASNVPVAVWLLQGFLRRVPPEVEEAAQLDGAGRLTVLGRVVLPLAAPSLVSVGTIVGLLGYSELLLASVVTQDPGSQTLPVVLSLMLGERVAEYGKVAAASVIGMLPVVLVAVVLQRRLVTGLTAGAVR